MSASVATSTIGLPGIPIITLVPLMTVSAAVALMPPPESVASVASAALSRSELVPPETWVLVLLLTVVVAPPSMAHEVWALIATVKPLHVTFSLADRVIEVKADQVLVVASHVDGPSTVCVCDPIDVAEKSVC